MLNMFFVIVAQGDSVTRCESYGSLESSFQRIFEARFGNGSAKLVPSTEEALLAIPSHNTDPKGVIIYMTREKFAEARFVKWIRPDLTVVVLTADVCGLENPEGVMIVRKLTHPEFLLNKILEKRIDEQLKTLLGRESKLLL